MPTPKRLISSRVAKQNPRPRKYASAAERQKALRERFPTLCVRVEQEQADFMKRIADEQGRTLQDVHLAFIKYANGRGNQWLTQGLKGFAPLPRFEETPKENPMKRKPTPAQIAARERFAEMARSGAFKKKAAKRNPAKIKRNPISDIANIIYNQLGANRFAMMTGAKNFVAGDNFLMFSIGKNQSVYNKVRITLTPDDLYDLEFFKMNRLGDISKTQKFEGVYAEQLRDLFTQVTGLYTSMGTMGRRSNPRASNPIILVSDKAIATKRKRNPINALSIKYACIMPEPGGMAYGIDERTPVTIRFSASELKRAYKCYLIPANVRESAGYKRLIAKQKEVYMSLAELKQLFRSFV